MIRLFEGVLGKDRLIALVLSNRTAKAERPSELSRLMNELVGPLQMIRPFGEFLQERSLAKL
jgi:hypothetical protein